MRTVSRSGGWMERGDRLAVCMLVPAMSIIILILLVPLMYSLVTSFFQYNPMHPENNAFVGLSNYINILTDPDGRKSLYKTIIFAGVSVSFELVLGVIFALILNLSFRGNRLVRTIILVPMMVSQVVAALSWLLMFHADVGLLNYLLGLFGIPGQLWLGNELAMVSVILVEIWQHTPFVTLIVLAGLQGLPKEVLEAAAVDGASGWRRLWTVVLPLIKPIILVALVFRTMFTLRVFSPVWVLTGGGPANETLVAGVDIYRTAFRYHEFGTATALSWILIFVTFVITIIYMYFLRRESVS